MELNVNAYYFNANNHYNNAYIDILIILYSYS